MSWCTSGVGLQVLPFIDNRHLGSIPRFHRIPYYCCMFYFGYSDIVYCCNHDISCLLRCSHKR